MVRARLVLMTIALMAGCAACASSPMGRSTPHVGGPVFLHVAAPHRPMNALERPIAQRLAGWARAQGLHVDGVWCPRWDHDMPEALTCQAWFDGVPANVRIRLDRMRHRWVGYDARVVRGVVATARLEQRLRRSGYAHPDCGRTRAYPVRLGLKLVCKVHRNGHASYVVATVVSRGGAVSVRGY
ncbi:MAG: hypothetical protein ACRDPI_05615 [Nocardioidaceae bacterium]